MPELPEVETMVRGIRPHVAGRTILDVKQCRTECKPIQLKPGFRQFRQKSAGQTIMGVRRLGKRVVLELESHAHVVIEPRMTGLVLLADPPDVEHLRLEWKLSGHGDYDSFWFWDRRGLGTITFFEPGKLQSYLGPEKLGPDALEMTISLWAERCRQSRREIKVLLLDQKIVAGIGNLYASEILHRASISPVALANTLKSKAIERLAESVQSVLLQAVEYEGSTLGDGTYRNALNQNGRYQNEHRVYMREGQSCVVCRTGSIVRIVQTQRSTFYCPKCQK